MSLSSRWAADNWHALSFAGVVLLVVIGVRIVLKVMLEKAITHGSTDIQNAGTFRRTQPCPRRCVGLVWHAWIGDAGNRLALPQEFPGHDLILLGAGRGTGHADCAGDHWPLIRMLRFAADNSLVKELALARVVLLDLAIEGLRQRDDEPAQSLRDRW